MVKETRNEKKKKNEKWMLNIGTGTNSNFHKNMKTDKYPNFQ